MSDAPGSPTFEDLTPGQGAEPGTPLDRKADEIAARRGDAAPPAGDTETVSPDRRPPGRPKGRRDSRPRKIARRPPRPERPRPEPAAVEPPAPPEPPSEAEVAGVAQLCAVAWHTIAGRFGRRDLADGEARQLAEASIPVMRKYGGGFLEQYGAEITLAITVWGLWGATAPAPAPAEQPEEVVQ